MDLIKAFAYPLPVTVISDMLGIPEEDREAVQQWSEIRFDGFRDAEDMEQTRKMIAAFSNYLRDLFERKRRASADDMRGGRGDAPLLGPIDYLGSVRTTKKDMVIGETPIPKGAQLAIGLGSANRDPSSFEDPDTYDISRVDAHRHIAFGRGIHLCLGAPLARLEGQIAFETLLRRFPDLRLATPAEGLRWGGAAGLRGFRELPVLL